MPSSRNSLSHIWVRQLSLWSAVLLVSVLALTLLPSPPVSAEPPTEQQVVAPRLQARATLSADYVAPGPRSGADATPANGRTGPFDGQIIPGFSAAVANADGTFWAMPDNGFGTKANSADFLLRIYLVRPHWGRDQVSGSIQVIRSITLSDPRHVITFPIVRESTRKRLLTGGDFDVESLQRMPDGTFWIGEEFGPFLLHVDRRGRVLSRPVPSPLGRSPQHPRPAASAPRVQTSGGFEATALSPNGRYLYPVLEKSLVDDSDPRRRVISEFDTRAGRYTGRRWDYRVDTDANLVADAQMLSRDTMLVLERDDLDGDAAVTKRIYRVDLRRTDRSEALAKSLHVDLLKLDNPDKVGDGGGWGTGDPFSFGLRSVETLAPLPDGRIMIVNDNNYPGDAARRPGTPDDTEMILLDPDTTMSVAESEHTVIAHRGASGYRPEHTLAAYALAIRQCADVIEPDIVMTKDNVPVARHENDISDTTDVADRPEFDDRETTKIIDGTATLGWFTEDFTLAELRTLRAKERLPTQRPANTAFDGLYPIPTLAEVLDLARHSRTCSGQPVGVTPETKHPTYFAAIGQPFDGPLLDALSAADLNHGDAPVMIQSFETTNLKQLNQQTDVSLSQLINCSGRPYDLRLAGDPRTYADLAKPAELRAIAEYADAVGLCKDVMIPRYPTGHPEQGRLMAPTPVIADAHAAGLMVIGWTFRRENRYLPVEFRSSLDPAAQNAPGNLAGEIMVFLGAGMDGYFTDNPDVGSSLDIA